ncbi:MAG: putative 2-aminoethylphosphonate ABC transporter permease subunit [Gammaproteobacteria bacterium]|nr:putative 2-aminoethylphosphonate ABC transporter permease subunit [Gammaproteobacteria bacterium]
MVAVNPIRNAVLATPVIKPKLGRDDWIMRLFMAVIGLYLLISLALPLYAVLSKSFTVFQFSFGDISVQLQRDGHWQDAGTLEEWVGRLSQPVNNDLAPTSLTRLPILQTLTRRELQGVSQVRLRDTSETGGRLLYDAEFSKPGEIFTLEPRELRKLFVRPVATTGLNNYLVYFQTPALRQSIGNSLYIAVITTLITVALAFAYAYAITRSCMPFSGAFRTIAMVPILVPSLLPAISLVYLFGNQGLLKGLLLGEPIYGPLGIVIASVFFCFPHAMLIILVALSAADARLYEAAEVLRTPKSRVFWTVTVPGASYGVISAAFVVFSLTITDFGVPKVIGGQFNVLALDIYKQVVGQQNFEMGAVVSVILLLPAILAFAVDRFMQRRQVALLSARAVPLIPKPNRALDRALLIYCSVVALFILGLLAMSQLASLIQFWPYDLSFSLRHYDFGRMDGGGWDSYFNSIRLGLYTAVIGTLIVFLGAYMVEKCKGFSHGRAGFQFLAMMPMAIPGMVLGLAYVFFFNSPHNPLNFLYGTMAILVICTITHLYTVSHLTSLTALKQLDPEFEAVGASLKQPFYRTLSRVTTPICLPAIFDIFIYLFVNAMTTVSAVVFLYSPDTTLASVAMLNMDDAGDIAPAAAMGMMIFYTNVSARLAYLGISQLLFRSTQAWRKR